MAAPILLCDTTGMSNDRWLECRMHGPKGDIPYTIGGSDVAAIFGVSPWTTPLELWMIKKGRMKPKPKDNADQLEMGHLLEPIAAYWYAKKSGNYVYDDKGLYQHADHPYALANFDRRYERASDGQPGILECKSCTYHKAEDWVDDAIPLYYEFQLRFYLAVADVQHGAFSCFWGNNPANDLAMPEIKRDLVKEDMIFERLDEWIWSLEHDVPPTMSGVKPTLAMESLARIYGASKPGLPTIELPYKFERQLRQIANLQAKVKECEDEKKLYEKEIEAHSVRIAEVMKEHEHLGHLIEFIPHGYIKAKYGATAAKTAMLNNDKSVLNFGAPDGAMATFAAGLLELQEKGLINEDVLTATNDNCVDAFVSGKAAMFSNGMWALSSVLAKDPEMADKIGFAPYPAMMEDGTPMVLVAEDSGYSISADTEHVEEAKAFLTYLFSADNQKKYAESLGSPSAFMDVDAKWAPDSIVEGVNNAVSSAANIGFTNEKPAGFSGDDAGRMVQDLLAGKYTAEEFAKAYEAAWDAGF